MRCLKKQKVILAVLLLLLTSLLAISGSMPIIQTVETFFELHSHEHSHENGNRPHHHSFKPTSKPVIPETPERPDVTILPIPGTPVPGTPVPETQVPETPVPETPGCLSKDIDLKTLSFYNRKSICNNDNIKEKLDINNNEECKRDKEFRNKLSKYDKICYNTKYPSNNSSFPKDENMPRTQSAFKK